jgi:formylglycine-generating enzyme required for sulfatase activity
MTVPILHAIRFRAATLALPVALALTPACSDDAADGAFELLVDTDLPTPEIASRVRIDAFTEASSGVGQWFDSREFDTDKPGAFPLSFGVLRDKGPVLLRIRVYPAGKSRSYRGERFAEWPQVLDPDGVAPTDGPRLISGARDLTPEREPRPATAIDRLVRVDAASPSGSRVVLRAACAGTMANLTTRETCVDTFASRVPVASSSLEPARSGETLSNSLRQPCAPEDSSAERVCVPGGVFLMGDVGDDVEHPSDTFLQVNTERLVQVPRFWMDRHEISVGRYRAASQRGFAPKRYSPAENDGAWVPNPLERVGCTYSKAPQGRESFALSCASWVTFRELCQFEGGELPRESQWEYAARYAGGAAARLYPNGAAEPVCTEILYGRVRGAGCDRTPWPEGLALFAADGSPRHAQDVTPLGIYDLGGSLGEFVLDNIAEYTDSCFANAPMNDVHCGGAYPDPSLPDVPGAQRVVRGGSWTSPPGFIRTTTRLKGPVASPFFGARCVYGAAR